MSEDLLTAPRPSRQARVHDPGTGSWIPSPALISAKLLELRKRRGLMITTVLLTVGLPVIVLGLRMIFHAIDPKSYSPAGSPGVFAGLTNAMAEFGFIISATVGASAATTDLGDGVFRQLVVTGRSRLALYLARIPAGLSIVMPLLTVGFAIVCLVTSYAGSPQPKTVNVAGASIPLGLSETQLQNWALQHPQQIAFATGGCPSCPGSPSVTKAELETAVRHFYPLYASDEPGALNPPINEMFKIGLWLALDLGIGFVVGLGLGSLIGQRTVATVLMIVLQLVVTPILANVRIAYFLNGQRLIVGVAMDQLRPAWLLSGSPGHGRILFGGRGALGIPPMPTWAMISVIVGWIVVWTAVGAWKMVTRDA
jgi:hypothetical protein